MDEPLIASRKPIEIHLEKAKSYHWCSCGKSATQPFCDGSHRGGSFTPLEFTADEDGAAWLCQCKHTANPPYCDGSHARLEDAPAETEKPVTNATGVPAPRNTPEEPTLEFIHALARDGLAKTGPHGPMAAMGVSRAELPSWDDIQILPAQLAAKPLQEGVPVGTKLIVGPNARRPLELKIPLFVSDMSYGALSEEAKIALAKGAEAAGTGICSGEGGMLPEENAANSRYFYELASAKFGYDESLLDKIAAFHFKGGQGAKTGTGGHLPGNKVTEKIARVRRLTEG